MAGEGQTAKADVLCPSSTFGDPADHSLFAIFPLSRDSLSQRCEEMIDRATPSRVAGNEFAPFLGILQHVIPYANDLVRDVLRLVCGWILCDFSRLFRSGRVL